MSDIFQSYLAASATLPGWFFPRSIAIWDCLLGFQREQALVGNVMEIGVWRGRSALLAAMHAQAGEQGLFVDPALHAKTQELLAQATAAQCTFVCDVSSTLHRSPLVAAQARTYRWIHIDGEHSGTAVYDDLTISHQLLHDGGVLVIDDFFNPVWPQITTAAIQFCARHTHELSMFLVADNKGYFCRPRQQSLYTRYLRERMFDELKRRGQDNFTICKTTVADDLNCFGIVNRFKNRDFVGPDWAEDSLGGE